MALEGELARAGIATLDDETVITKDTKFNGDVLVEGDMHVSGDSVFDGSLVVSGSISGVLLDTYVLEATITALNAATGCYVVVPTGGEGYISMIRTVLLDVLTTPDAVLSAKVNTAGTNLTNTITIAFSGSAVGDVDDSGAIPSDEGHNDVVASDFIKVWPSTPGGSASSVRVQVEITRT